MRATFQSVITTSHKRKESHAIFIYEALEWSQITKNVFIGYSDDQGFKFTSIPSLILRQKGNWYQ